MSSVEVRRVGSARLHAETVVDDRMGTTQAIVSTAMRSLSGILEAHMIQDLEYDMQVTLEIVLEGHDGTDYLNHFRSKGVQVNKDLVARRSELYRSGPYKQIPDEEWDSMTEANRYALILGSASVRGAGGSSVRSRDIRSGISKHQWPDPPEGMSSAVAFSAFAHPVDEIPAFIAWVEVPVEFQDQSRCIVRLMFRWDEQAGTWVPYLGATYSTGGTMPLLLL